MTPIPLTKREWPCKLILGIGPHAHTIHQKKKKMLISAKLGFICIERMFLRMS